MAFRFTPNCGCCCNIMSDDFTRADDTDPGAKWDEVSAGAAIVSNRLRMNTDGALVVSTAVGSGDAFYTKVTLYVSTAGIKSRLIVDYVDSDNYHFLEVHFRHTGDTTTLQLYKRTAGVDSSIGTAQTTDLYALDDAMLLHLCVDTDGRFLASLNVTLDSVLLTCIAVSTLHGGTKVGLAQDGAGTIYWDDFDWQTHKSETGSCPECQIGCGICQNGLSTDVTLIVTGVTDGTCSECENVNGTFVLPAICLCEWAVEIPDICGAEATEHDCFGDDLGMFYPMWQVITFLTGSTLEIYATLLTQGTGVMVWGIIIDPFDGTCEFDEIELEFVGSDGPCTSTGSTVTLSLNV